MERAHKLTIHYPFVMTNLCDQMQRAQFYPHPVTLPIKVIQTHISWVFLTGEYAYKLKKPVDFGFLDFTTLAKRKFFIEEELRLNKRIAPDIYLETLPISKHNDRYVIGIDDSVEEYVLKMKQFPQESLLINMFNSGNLTENLLIELGEVVANFHQKTETNDYIKTFGTIAVIKESIEGNYQATEKYIGLVQTQEKYQQTKEFSDRFLAEKKNQFLQRITDNKIRECHGDLHLKNICYWQNKIQLFDCIEFNEPFRFVDVIYDVAFTVMDLDARGKPELGNIFLNSYLEQTGDWQAIEILPLYLCRQAYVRAKVTSFLLDDPNITPAEKQTAMETAKGYYELAWRYTQPLQGQIILMTGLSGSGKSTTAKKIAPQLNAIQIRSDALRKHLAHLPLTESAPLEIYSNSWTQKTYNRLLELGVLVAKNGYPVILDATFSQSQWRQKAIALAEKSNLPLSIIYCHAPVPVLQQRLANRSNDVSDATPELLLQQTFEPFTEKELAYVVKAEQFL